MVPCEIDPCKNCPCKIAYLQKGFFAKKKFVKMIICKMIICQSAPLPKCTFSKMLLCLNASLQEITCKMSLCKSNLKNFQIDPISAQVVENFMANNLKKYYIFIIQEFVEFLKHPIFP